jgi:hypothetical protein
LTKPFFLRLAKYYESVADEIKSKSAKASVFANTTDIGLTRESAYLDFLKLHLPKKCDIFFGGFLFGRDGSESAQIDVIITTDACPRFDIVGNGNVKKSFAPVDGCLGIASIKSNLDKKNLQEALEGFASLPDKLPLDGKINPNFRIPDYEDWPTKILYSSQGLDANTILNHINEFYEIRSEIPIGKRPSYVHVGGKFLITRFKNGMTYSTPDVTLSSQENAGKFFLTENKSDMQAISWVLHDLQSRAVAATHMTHEYGYLINEVLDAL